MYMYNEIVTGRSLYMEDIPLSKIIVGGHMNAI